MAGALRAHECRNQPIKLRHSQFAKIAHILLNDEFIAHYFLKKELTNVMSELKVLQSCCSFVLTLRGNDPFLLPYHGIYRWKKTIKEA
jgi:hypothetical protein